MSMADMPKDIGALQRRLGDMRQANHRARITGDEPVWSEEELSDVADEIARLKRESGCDLVTTSLTT